MELGLIVRRTAAELNEASADIGKLLAPHRVSYWAWLPQKKSYLWLGFVGNERSLETLLTNMGIGGGNVQ